MAITVINTYTGTTSAGSTGIACQAGDMFVAFAWRNSATALTLPSAWFGHEIDVTSSFCLCLAVKMIKPGVTSVDINETFTNATGLIIVHLRPSSGRFLCPGQYDWDTIASTTTVNYGFAQSVRLDAANVYLLFGATAATNSNITTNTLSGCTKLASQGTSGVAHITGAANYNPRITNSIGGSSAVNVGVNFEVDEYDPAAKGDDFNRSDENLGVSAATGTYGGWSWDTSGTTAGHAGVRSNQLAGLTANASGSIYKCATGRMTTRAKWKVIDRTGNGFIITRYGSSGDYLGARVGGTATTNIAVFSRNTSSAFTSQYDANHSVAVNDVIEALHIGSYMNLYRNGTLVAGNINCAMSLLNGAGVGAVHARQAVQNPWLDDLEFSTYVHPSEISGGTNVSTTLTGQSMTASGGTLTATGKQNVSTTLTGQSMTISQGTLTAIGKTVAALTGLPMTSSVGSLTVTGGAKATLTGQAMTASQGTLTPSIRTTVSLTGMGMTPSQGTLTVLGKTVISLTGQGMVVGQGSLTILAGGSIAVGLTGQAATVSQGSLTVVAKRTVATVLTGQSLTAALGTLTARGGASATLTGQLITTGQGTMTVVTTGTGVVGLVKIWTGSAWVEKPAKVWTGSAWVQKPAKYWNGSAWVT